MSACACTATQTQPVQYFCGQKTKDNFFVGCPTENCGGPCGAVPLGQYYYTSTETVENTFNPLWIPAIVITVLLFIFLLL